ncbi:MAG: PhnD/SsuA/transferrin family substrate-binding protein [Alphaproteobacteria bacterium]|nr:PhnD/SsuA/transferrin family substrate-binding protein [Alphaproteobacteria bacterium]
MSAGPEAPATPQRVGSYHLIERLAVGGMAEVFLACQRGDQSLDRLVVLKRILPHLAQNPEFVEAFGREARITARIRHPNVVQIHELGESGGLPFIAMEYVPGSTLKQLVVAARQTEVRLPVDVCVHLLMQSCAGVHAAHELTDPHGKPYGLVHRDVSPHNLMVDDQGHVKLLDFGIAKASEGMDHTRTGMLKGKISYMSPEQCRQEKLDRRSDVFALGVCAYEMFAGSRPFQAPSELATMQAIVAARYTPLDKLRPEIPEGVVAAVHKAMALRPEDRQQTADEMRRELKAGWGREIDTDRVTLFVRTLLGDRHATRRKAVEEALERTLVSFSGHPPASPADIDIASATNSTSSIRGRPHTGAGTAPGVVPAAAPTGEPTRTLEPPPTTPPSLLRRSLPFAVGLGLLLGVSTLAALGAFAAWWTHEPALVLEGPPVHVSIAPVMDPARLAADHEPIRKYLEKTLLRPVSFDITPSYEDAADGVIDGTVPFAFLPRGTVAYAKAKAPELRILAVKVVDGSASTDGYLVVRREEGAPGSIGELKGRTICLADPLSSTGWRLPRTAIEQAGLVMDQDVKVHASGNHQQVLIDLLDGVCDVGATYSNNFNSADQRGIAIARLRILAMTGTAPHDAFVSGKGADEALANAVQDALVAFDPKRDAGTERVGESELITGFVVPRDDYLTVK